MKHPHVTTLETFYAALARKDLSAALSLCSDQMTFQVPGKSTLAGKFTKATFSQELAGKWAKLSDSTLQFDIHDILASDLHATVLLTERLSRNGKTHELRAVHVWRFEGAKPLAWYEYARDLYAFDAIWT